MKIAVIGSGISGLVAAYLLAPEHAITVFEANDYIGGHTHTHDIQTTHGAYAIDTGFIVFNERNYPNFVRLLRQLDVESMDSSMSFSVSDERTGLEYNGTSLNKLFAQRRNLARPRFLRMLAEIVRFNRNAKEFLKDPDPNLSFGEFLNRGEYAASVRDDYIIPMGAAIWSADPHSIVEFPAVFFLRFFENHAMLENGKRPVWRVIKGGSREYVKKLTASFSDRIRLRQPVEGVRRFSDRIEIESGAGKESFDACVLAIHSDQALRILKDASNDEKSVLGEIPYQKNHTVLHTDAGLLPRARLAWASWNYHRLKRNQREVAVTYYMNELQRLKGPTNFCVTLNRPDDMRSETVLKRLLYHHPVYTRGAVLAQERHALINGKNRTYFCGAYWGSGFHEDGVVSGLRVAAMFGRRL